MDSTETVATPPLPSSFSYDRGTETLIVEFTNGQKLKFVHVDHRLMFLRSYKHRSKDFLIWWEQNPAFEVI